METWLPRFIVQARQVLGITSATGLPLCGSIGFDAELLSDGTVIWHSYDIAGEDLDVWRVASREERISALILGAERMPQLSVLLPSREAHDVDCTACERSGYILGGRVLCRECGGAGWTPSPNSALQPTPTRAT